MPDPSPAAAAAMADYLARRDALVRAAIQYDADRRPLHAAEARRAVRILVKAADAEEYDEKPEGLP